MTTTDSITNLAAAVQAVQADVGAVAKDSSGFGYKYTSYPAWCAATRRPMHANGLTFMHMMDNIAGEPALITILFHSSGEFIRSAFPLMKAGVAKANDAQDMGAAVSYARRYNESAMLGIPSGDRDDDAERLTYPPRASKTTPPPAKPNAKPGIPESAFKTLDGASSIDELRDLTLALRDQARAQGWEPELMEFGKKRAGVIEQMTKEVFGNE